MKRILVFAPGRDYMRFPSFRLRLAPLIEPLARRGFQLEVRVRPKTPWGRIGLARSAGDYDGVILHRELLDAYEARILRRSLAPGRRIFMDIDDATMFHETDVGIITRRRLERRFAATAAIVDVICAGNQYLGEIFQRQAANGTAICLMPTVVEPGEYRVKRHGTTEEPRLVWIGSSSTLKYVELAYQGMREAARRLAGLKLVVICDRPPQDAALPVEFIQWTLGGEKDALTRGDIGIAPTPEDRWTLGKCGFKIVQYMAAGLPVIASPVGVNVELVQRTGTGILAADSGQWTEAILKLAGDAALRAQLGTAGRSFVETRFSLEQNADRWAGVLG